jgi:hypothetical protein
LGFAVNSQQRAGSRNGQQDGTFGSSTSSSRQWQSAGPTASGAAQWFSNVGTGSNSSSSSGSCSVAVAPASVNIAAGLESNRATGTQQQQQQQQQQPTWRPGIWSRIWHSWQLQAAVAAGDITTLAAALGEPPWHVQQEVTRLQAWLGLSFNFRWAGVLCSTL